MCECVSWIDVIVLTCIIVFFQILMYKIGFSQGEQSVYNRLEKLEKAENSENQEK